MSVEQLQAVQHGSWWVLGIAVFLLAAGGVRIAVQQLRWASLAVDVLTTMPTSTTAPTAVQPVDGDDFLKLARTCPGLVPDGERS